PLLHLNSCSTRRSADLDTYKQKFSYASCKLTGSAPNDGAQYTFPTSLPTGTYQIAISVKTNASFPSNTLVFGFVESGVDQNCASDRKSTRLNSSHQIIS